MDHEFIDNCLIILPKQTMDIFLREENPAELIALYSFYYYTAKWQETNQPKCTASYAAKGLHWGERKVNKVNKRLKEIGLIEPVKHKSQSGKISGHFIKVKFIFSSNTENRIHTVKNERYGYENHTVNFPQCGTNHGVEDSMTNALSTNNKNPLNKNNLNALSNNIFPELEKNEPKNTPMKQTSEGVDKKISSGVIRKKYGEYENVLLSDTEFEKLKKEFPNDYQERIERLSEYIASTGKKYKNFLATIRVWSRRDTTYFKSANIENNQSKKIRDGSEYAEWS